MNLMPKNADIFKCEHCDFKCSKQSNWSTHLLTRKHQNRMKLNEKNEVTAAPSFVCKKCDKSYKARNSLWYHENKCSLKPVVTEKINADLIERILDDRQRILDDNAELRNFIMEQSKMTTETVNKALELCKPVNNNTTINQTNNNNQRFNINLFLNEQCKDAINFSDFVKNIQISYEDLENNAQLGFVNGISKIFLDNLKQLDVTERPIHCTDVKRETMYIKDENTWTKQPDDDKLQKAIQTVSYRSMGKLAEWKQENPDYKDCNSEFSQKCLDIQRQTLAGSERGVYYPKVIHALARETIVEK
jgi:hypothetical protein